MADSAPCRATGLASHRALRRACRHVMSAALLLLLGGCCVLPRDRAEALSRVNDNLARIDQPLYYSAWVSCKFRDADNKLRRLPAQDATLIFCAPQRLILDIKQSLAGIVAQFGCNDEHYWLWIEPEIRKLWIGRWDRLGDAATGKLALPPNDLLDALLLRPLPETSPSGAPPELRKRGLHYWLIYARRSAAGQPLGTREVRLSLCAPYQPREIIDRLPDGRTLMHAKLSWHRRVGRDGPYTARKYVVRWPLNDAELRLDVLRARFRPDLDDVIDDITESPLYWQGEIEDLDAPADGRAADQESR